MTEAVRSAHMSTMEPITAPSVIERLATAQNPNAEAQELWQLIDDPNDTVANTARHRLNLVLRPLQGLHIPVIDSKTGLVVQP